MIFNTFLTVIFLTTGLFAQEFDHRIAEMEKAAHSNFFSLSKVNYPGDSKIDVTYYKLDLTLTHTPNYLIGAVTVNARVDTLSITNLFLDLRDNMDVDSVLLNGTATTFDHSNNELTIDLDRVYVQNEIFSVVVFYQGVPVTSGFSSFKFGTHDGQPIISTLSEPYGASDWWPCKDTPADKVDSADIWITVDQSMIPVSNGMIQEIILNGDGTHTYKWKEQYPIVHYLISLAITNYHQYDTYYHYSSTDSMIITHYSYPERFNNSRKALLDETSAMIEVFSQRYGEYPFIYERYGHAEFTGMFGGAMEHQTCSSMGFYGQGIIAHELAHQWFGNMITCKDWHHIWLNEGFATYSEGVYYEAIGGQSAYDQFIVSEMNYAKQAQGTIWVQNINSIGEIFNGNRTYAKGGIVLHMLRGVVGDSTFFDIMRTYAAHPDYAYNVATTEDFQAVAESVYGQPLDYFFQEWIYGEKYPIYNVAWTYNEIGGDVWRVHINIEQTPRTNPKYFTMPIKINISTTNGDTLVTIFNDQLIQDFEIDVNGGPLGLQFDYGNWMLKTLSITTGVDDKITINEYSLDQNYPNPFNPSTKIKYQIAKSGFVELKICNVLGKEVSILVNKEMQAGSYEIEFDASNLSSGIYFYTLNAGKFIQTRKMIYLK
ncbi:MAG: T9SS type A sorting domain-containing protein [Bacteroidetes bacterium]|nr:T9SS type A sorting domain-containing protein [Bacteroidota bacterium]